MIVECYRPDRILYLSLWGFWNYERSGTNGDKTLEVFFDETIAFIKKMFTCDSNYPGKHPNQ